jgi:hypothetical protein
MGADALQDRSAAEVGKSFDDRLKRTACVRLGPRNPFGVRFSHRTNPEWLAIARSLRANLQHASGVRKPQPGLHGC